MPRHTFGIWWGRNYNLGLSDSKTCVLFINPPCLHVSTDSSTWRGIFVHVFIAVLPESRMELARGMEHKYLLDKRLNLLQYSPSLKEHYRDHPLPKLWNVRVMCKPPLSEESSQMKQFFFYSEHTPEQTRVRSFFHTFLNLTNIS